MSNEPLNPRRIRYGLPGMTGAFVLASGVTCWWCREPGIAAMLLLLLVAAAAGSVAVVVASDY